MVSNFLEQPAYGVPYIIIGDKVFGGYSSRYDDQIKEAIVDLYNSTERYDVLKEIEKKEDTEYSDKNDDKNDDEVKVPSINSGTNNDDLNNSFVNSNDDDSNTSFVDDNKDDNTNNSSVNNSTNNDILYITSSRDNNNNNITNSLLMMIPSIAISLIGIGLILIISSMKNKKCIVQLNSIGNEIESIKKELENTKNQLKDKDNKNKPDEKVDD